MPQVKFISKDDELLFVALFPERGIGEPAREVKWQGRRFVESDGGPDCFYPRGTFVEVPEVVN